MRGKNVSQYYNNDLYFHKATKVQRRLSKTTQKVHAVVSPISLQLVPFLSESFTSKFHIQLLIVKVLCHLGLLSNSRRCRELWTLKKNSTSSRMLSLTTLDLFTEKGPLGRHAGLCSSLQRPFLRSRPLPCDFQRLNKALPGTGVRKITAQRCCSHNVTSVPLAQQRSSLCLHLQAPWVTQSVQHPHPCGLQWRGEPQEKREFCLHPPSESSQLHGYKPTKPMFLSVKDSQMPAP